MSKSQNRELRQLQAIKSINRMLWKKAWITWKRLPPSTRYWIDPEDVYQEALFVAIRCYRKWDPTRGASYPTLTYRSVDNYMNTYVAFWSCQKRHQQLQVELEVVDWCRNEDKVDLIIDSVVQVIHKVHEQIYLPDSVMTAFEDSVMTAFQGAIS